MRVEYQLCVLWIRCGIIEQFNQMPDKNRMKLRVQFVNRQYSTIMQHIDQHARKVKQLLRPLRFRKTEQKAVFTDDSTVSIVEVVIGKHLPIVANEQVLYPCIRI